MVSSAQAIQIKNVMPRVLHPIVVVDTCGFLPVETVIVVGHRDDPRLRVQHQRRIFVAQNGRVPNPAERARVRVDGLYRNHSYAGRGVLWQLGRVRAAGELWSVVVDVVQVDHYRRPRRRPRVIRINAPVAAGHGQLGSHYLSVGIHTVR